MKYCSKLDISVAIQCLKVIVEKKGMNENIKRLIVPRLLRVILELEDIGKY